MTNSLITVFNGTISNSTVQLCNACDLHSFLEIQTRFADWIKRQITDYGFVQDEDYIIVTERTSGRPRKEYHITLDMGKELAMVERNEKGRQIRKYFIECERKILQKNSEIKPLAPPPKTYTFDFTEKELQSLVWAWFAFVRGIHTFRYIYCPSPETRWKKGHGCWWKARELGAERINIYGNVEVKVSMTRPENGISRKMWRFRSHIVWEQHTGEAPPKGMIVLHLNSDPLDDRIENLALVTQRENLALLNHGFHKLPPDPQIRQAMLTLVKFDIKRREFDEKHGLYKKYVAPKKAQSTCTAQAGTQEGDERGENSRQHSHL